MAPRENTSLRSLHTGLRRALLQKTTRWVQKNIRDALWGGRMRCCFLKKDGVCRNLRGYDGLAPRHFRILLTGSESHPKCSCEQQLDTRLPSGTRDSRRSAGMDDDRQKEPDKPANRGTTRNPKKYAQFSGQGATLTSHKRPVLHPGFSKCSPAVEEKCDATIPQIVLAAQKGTF